MQIKYSELFTRSFDHIVNCGQNIYGTQTIKSLLSGIKHSRDMLSLMPEFGAPEPLLNGLEPLHRHIILGKYFKLIYVVHKDAVHFIDIWDTRQSPTRLVDRVNEI